MGYPLLLTRLLVRSGVARWLPAVRRLTDGGSDFVHYYSDRVLAALKRQPVDRVPYAVWRHFPAVDRSPAGLAQATLRFHERYGPDFLKITPSGGYAVQAWGCVEGDEVRPDGHPPVEGRVEWVSREAEYTPRNVQTREERVTQVFRAKVRITGDASRLKDGMWADVVLR